MLDCTAQRQEFHVQLTSIRALLDATHQPTQTMTPDVSREVRGLCILLLYASYERLMHSLCRSMLEAARSLGVGNRRLRPGLRVFAAFQKLQSIKDSTAAEMWRKRGLEVVNILGDSKTCTISPDVFPNDGSNMRRSQVSTFCTVFDLGDPAPVLREVWQHVDTVVTERNAIAHGQATADEVGRRYSIGDLRELVDLWDQRWNVFLDHVESVASRRDFYRYPR